MTAGSRKTLVELDASTTVDAPDAPHWFGRPMKATRTATSQAGQEDTLDHSRTASPKAPADLTLRPLAKTPPKEAQQRAARAIEATVLGITDESIFCEVRGDNAMLRVNLLRALFPTDVHTGTPVAIRMENVGGVRTPVISQRQIAPVDDPRIAEMDALIGRLEP
jgi:hypothetical protein